MKYTIYILLILIVSCSHTPVVVSPPRDIPQPEFWQGQELRTQSTRRLQGTVVVRAQWKKQRLTGRGQFLTQLPAQVRMELRDPLGRLQYLLNLSGSNVTAYYPREKLVYLDEKSGEAYLTKFMGLDITLPELQDFLIGRIPNRFETIPQFDEWAWEGATGYYRGVMKWGGRHLVAEVDPRTLALKALRIENKIEEILIQYKDFAPCCHPTKNIQVAQTVRVSLKVANTEFEFSWKTLEAFKTPKNDEVFSVQLPEGVKTIVLR